MTTPLLPPAEAPERPRHGRFGRRASKEAIRRMMGAASRPRPPYTGPVKACKACGHEMMECLSMCPVCHASQWEGR